MGPKLGVLSAVFLALTGCGSSSPSGAPGPPHFTGPAWNATITTTENCAGEAWTSSRTFNLSFTAQGTNGLQRINAAGCTLDLTVSGDTGTLSNGPVTCSAVKPGAYVSNRGGGGHLASTAVRITVTAATYTSSDGLHLIGTESGTFIRTKLDEERRAENCTFLSTVSATRGLRAWVERLIPPF